MSPTWATVGFFYRNTRPGDSSQGNIYNNFDNLKPALYQYNVSSTCKLTMVDLFPFCLHPEPPTLK